MKSYILVAGGAGYIGSHMAKMLCQSGYDVIIVDNMSTGHGDAARYGIFVDGDIGNPLTISSIFTNYKISAVIDFAAFSQVQESTQDPGKYYQNNICCTLGLLQEMRTNNVKVFIFSSTAAIYGEPKYNPIDEHHPQQPINPYGHSKLIVEQILREYENSYGLRYISLRYFNAAGADPEGELGERHSPETHLIPLLLQVARGSRDHIDIYGNDYPTPDGTCVRDYVHVWDLCHAHLLALEYLMSGGKSDVLNLGNGQGYSVKEVIDATEHVTGRFIARHVKGRRAGDPAVLIADSKKARMKLGWEAKFDGLEVIIEHAWCASCRT